MDIAQALSTMANSTVGHLGRPVFSPMKHTSSPIDVGSFVGPYVLRKRISLDSRTPLFLATTTDSDKSVALRLVLDEGPGSAFWLRCVREARALAHVDHAGIARILETGDQDGVFWVASEFVKGTSLRQLVLERGPLSVTRAVRIVSQLADALAAIHDAGVAHRSLSASSVLLGHDEEPRLVNLCRPARRLESMADDALAYRDALVPLSYLAPEQVEHNLADARSDLWALGCLLAHLVAGHGPFVRDGMASTVAAIIRDEPDLPPQIPSALRAIILSCVTKNSFVRMGSASELQAMLKDVLASSQGDGSSGETSAPDWPTRPSRGSIAAPAPWTSSASELPPPSSNLGSGRPASQSRIPVRNPSVPPPSGPASAAGTGPSSVRRPSAPPSLLPSEGPRSERMPASRPPSLRPPAQPVAGTGRIKGTAIRPGLTWYEQVHGQDALRRALERCGSEAKPIFQGGNYPFGIVHSGWYDLVMVGDLLDAMIEEVQPVDVEAFHHQMTQAIAQDNVGGVYRALFRLIATPELLQSNIHRVWQTYCDDGNLEVEIPQRGQLRFVIEKLTRHHSTLCLSVGYTIQNVLRSIGFQGLSVQRVACMGEGAQRCVFEGDHL